MGIKCPHCTENIDGYVPQDRLDDMAKRRRDAEKRAKEAEVVSAGAAESTAQVEAWKAKAEALEADLTKANTAFSTERSIFESGITDPEGVKVARLLWDNAGEDRGELAEWLGSGQKALSAWQAAPPPADPAAPGTPPAAPAPPGSPPPPANRGAAPFNGQPGTLDAGAISNMSIEAYRAQRGSILTPG